MPTIKSLDECETAAMYLGLKDTEAEWFSMLTYPSGCIYVTDGIHGDYNLLWNNHDSNIICGLGHDSLKENCICGPGIYQY